jgi:hypothetical protein
MAKLNKGDICPGCREGEVRRVRRHAWMRWLPRSKCYRCDDCKTRFLTICGWALRLPKRKVRLRPQD